MGTDQLGVPVLEYLKENFNLSLVVTTSSSRIGRGRNTIRYSPIYLASKKLSLKIITPKKLKKAALEQINKAKPDFIMVYAYGKIIPLQKIECKKILNIHPSLLPELRGPSPIRYALLKGLKQTGVSLMEIDQEIDHGPVISQAKCLIKPAETYLSLKAKLKAQALALVKKDLLNYLSGKIKATDQNHSKASFSKMIKKQDGEINWEKPNIEIIQKIKAFNPWPGTFTMLNRQQFKIFDAKLDQGKIKLGNVQLAGRKKMKFEQFKQGYHQTLDFIDKLV